MIATRYRDTVIINTKDDRAFRGVYWGGGRQVVRLRGEVSMIGPETNGQWIRADHEVVVERSNVSFYQRVVVT